MMMVVALIVVVTLVVAVRERKTGRQADEGPRQQAGKQI
jgi:hypothetical protein